MVPGAGEDMSREKCLCGAWSWCGHVERKMPMWCLELVWTCREKNAYVVPGAGVDMSREKCLWGARSCCGHVERKMPMRCSELVWTWHVHISSGHHIGSSIAVRTGCDVEVDETLGLGRPKMMWKKFTEWLSWVEAHDSQPLREEHLEIRSEICYAYLEGTHLCRWCSGHAHTG